MQLGAVAVLVRQTNIIWVLFVACTGVIDLIQSKQKHGDNMLSEPKSDDFASSRDGNINPNLKKRRQGNVVHTATNVTSQTSLPGHSSGLPPFIAF